MILTREEKLMIRIGQGDMDAVDELIRLLYPEILRYCLWHAPNREFAEDAAQETFLKAIRYYDRYVHKGKCKAFLYRIAANTCVDMYRKMDCGVISIEDIPEELPSEEPGFQRIHADLSFRLANLRHRFFPLRCCFSSGVQQTVRLGVHENLHTNAVFHRQSSKSESRPAAMGLRRRLSSVPAGNRELYPVSFFQTSECGGFPRCSVGMLYSSCDPLCGPAF